MNTTRFIKLPLRDSSLKDLFVNPNLIKTIHSGLDPQSTFISMGGTNTYRVGLPIEEVFKLINNI